MPSLPPPQPSNRLVRLVDRSIAGTGSPTSLKVFVAVLLTSVTAAQDKGSGDWARIREAYDQERHAASAVGCGYEAHNPGQRWTTIFDGRGFEATPDSRGWSFGLELVRYGWDGDRIEVREPRRSTADGGRITYEWDDRLAEWYVNDRRGLEHGFTVLARSAEAEGPFSIELSIRGGLLPGISGNGRDVRFDDECGGAVLTYSGLTVFDSVGRALEARWRAVPGGLHLSVDDQDALYPLTIDPVVQQAYLKASDTEADDRFGESISASGDSAIVGADGWDGTSPGVVHVGSAYVFARNGSSWSQQGHLVASNAQAGDHFGECVAISGWYAVVGASFEDSSSSGVNGNQFDEIATDAGAAYVFRLFGTTWSQTTYLKASNPGFGFRFGSAVAIDGDTIVVGAFTAGWPIAGAAYVFRRSGTTWSQEALLTAANGDSDWFGYSVSISGDTIVVGAPKEDSDATGVNGDETSRAASNSGAAYVFTRSGTTWSQQAYLKASNTQTDDQFGYSVSVSGDTVLVGANQEDSDATGVDGNQSGNAASNSGAAYVFTRSGTTWSQQAYLKGPSVGTGDMFGWEVSVSGERAAVGAPKEDSNAIGVNGNPNDNTRQDSGAVVVFERSGTTWSQLAYIKSTNSNSFDTFGHSISVAGSTLLASAPGEDSNATGVNGDQSSNAASASGAAYVFGLDAPLFSTFCHPGIDGVHVCPCGQPANPSGGCANFGATATSGAVLGASGNASLGADTVVLATTNHRTAPPIGILNIFFTASGVLNLGVVSNAGVRCINTNLKRLYSGNTTAGALSKPGMGDASVSARSTTLGVGITAGETRHYFNVYRDSAATAPCGNVLSNTNLTNGGSITWGP
ncbi:MAG: FG-GAP repeat protein [Planctomycetota bacterium]